MALQTTSVSGVRGLQSVAFVSALVFALSPGLSCDPATNKPTTNAGAGCTWWYRNGIPSERNVLTSSSDVKMKKGWQQLDFCFCGLYIYPEVCPTCPPLENQVTITDSMTWTVQNTVTESSAFALKEFLIDALSYTYTLTTAEQQSLSGTHTETTTFTFRRQAVGCFTRYYREVWEKRTRSGKRLKNWVYYWQGFTATGTDCGTLAQTTCTETTMGTAVWNTYPNYQWAPSEPPCGGVPIQNPDEWDGKREKPCCTPLCPPPSPPTQSCCGCITQP